MKNKDCITLGSLFDGIGGFPYAAMLCGIKTLWASEIIPAAISVTRRHFPDMEHVGDITKLKGSELTPVNIISFGSPCQSFSVAAGQRKGLEGKSGLFWEAIRIIREMREATNGQYPQYSVFENVPGILSANRGRDYKTVLEAFTEAEIPFPPSGRWTNAGMVRGGRIDFAWIIHDAQYFGLSQRRRRLFAVCDFRGQCAAEILFKPKSLHRNYAEGGEARKRTSTNAQRSANGTEPDRMNTIAAFLGGQSAAAGSISYNEKVTPTLKSASGGNTVPCICEHKHYNETGNPAENTNPSIIVVNDQGGNSLTVEKTEISPTLRSEAHGNLPIVSIKKEYPINTQNIQRQSAITASNASSRNAPLVCHPEIAGTLCASGAGLSRPAGMCSETDLCVVTMEQPAPDKSDLCNTVAYCLQSNMIGRKDKNGPNGNGFNEKVAFTLTATDRHAVAAIDCRNLYETKEISGTLQAKGTSGGYSLNYQNPVLSGLVIRRLTPCECERLMGYPDTWTEYGHDGKPLSDTARYQALGNSIAIPCAAYVLSGIVDEFYDK